MKLLFLIVIISSFSLLSPAGSLEDARSEYALAQEDEKNSKFDEAIVHIDNAIKIVVDTKKAFDDDNNLWPKIFLYKKDLWYKAVADPEKLRITKEMDIFICQYSEVEMPSMNEATNIKNESVKLKHPALWFM